MNQSVRWSAGHSLSAYVGTYNFADYVLKLSGNAGVIDLTYDQARELIELLPEAVRQLKLANNIPDELPLLKPKPNRVVPYQDTVRQGRRA